MEDIITVSINESNPIPYEFSDSVYGSLTYEVEASYVLKENEFDDRLNKDAEWFINGTVESAVSMALFNASKTPLAELPKVLIGIEDEISKQTRFFCDFKSLRLINIVGIRNPE